MSDPGHDETDRIIAKVEKKVAREYAAAIKDTQAKLDDYFARFVKKDETWRKWVREGKKTEKEYIEWRKGQLAIGQRWQDMVDTLSADYHNANLVARSIVLGYAPEVYALNHNYATYDVEHNALVDTSYTLYNREAVERLIRDDPDLLKIPGQRLNDRIATGKDIAWQKGQIQSVATQAILQGESIPKISQRIATTMGESNHKSTIRYARTAMTSAENAGRLDAYRRAEGMGIQMQKTWIATLDSRTRDSHRWLDGTTIDVDEVFSNGCEYPGDPDGPPEEVWNCRCSMISQIKGFERDTSDLRLRNTNKLGDMTYDEWKSEHGVSQPITRQEEVGNAIRWSYIQKYRKG